MPPCPTSHWSLRCAIQVVSPPNPHPNHAVNNAVVGGVDVVGHQPGVVMAPSPSQSFAPAKDIYSTSNLYGTQCVGKDPQQQQQQHHQQQQQPASNFNDYMRSSELDDGSNRAIYVSSKMVSQQMENLSLSGGLPPQETSAQMYNPTNGK